LETSTKNSEFLRLYEPIHSNLIRFCRAISGNTEDAEDLMNDTLLNALESFDKIKDKTSFKSYVFSIASNLCKKKFRRSKFKADFNERELLKMVDLSQNPEYVTDFKIIYEQILTLPEKTAETVILFHISDLSIEEIQKIQGGSLSGVKLRLKRGREKLISQLETPRQLKVALMFFSF
jgi:RNA polymerase sigma-70 factor (ECF subfamily)